MFHSGYLKNGLLLSILLLPLFSQPAAAQLADTAAIKPLLQQAMTETDSSKVLPLLLQARQIAGKTADKKWYAETIAAEAVWRYNNNNYQQALRLFNQALELNRQQNNQLKTAHTLNNLSSIYSRLGLHDKAFAHALEAMQVYEKAANRTGMANALKNMADEIFTEYSKTPANFSRAKTYYEQACGILQQQKEYLMLAGAMNNLAVLYMDAGKPVESYAKLQQTRRFINQHTAAMQGNPANNPMADVLTNMGWVQLAGFKNYDSAASAIERAIAYCHSNFAYEPVLARNYLNLTEARLNQKNIAAAKFSADSCFYYSNASQDIFSLAESHKNLALIDSLTGHYQRAFTHYTAYVALKDSIAGNDKTLQLEGLNIRYETDKKEAENQQLRANASFRNKIILALTALALSLMAGLFYYRRSKKLQTSLYAQKAAVLEKENEILLLDRLLEEEENRKLKDENELQNRQLTASSLSIEQQQKVLADAYTQLYSIGQKLSEEDKSLARNLRHNIKSNLQVTADWEQVLLHFEKVHPDFFKSLTAAAKADLSQNDMKHCAYIKLNLGTKEIASLLNIDARSVRVSRYRLKKKLGLAEETDMQGFITSI